MTNQIFLNGAPVVGFGDTGTTPKPATAVIVGGALVGAVGGAALGALAGKGIGALIGAITGGIGGAFLAPALVGPSTASLLASSWHRLAPGETTVAGQKLAMAISSPDLAPLPPDVVTALNGLLSTQGGIVESDALYPPGTTLPLDWPGDDKLGPGAYRALIHSMVSGAAFDPANLWKQIPISATVAVWTK